MGFHLGNCPKEGGGGGVRGMLECVCGVCVQGFIEDFEFWEGENSKVLCLCGGGV